MPIYERLLYRDASTLMSKTGRESITCFQHMEVTQYGLECRCREQDSLLCIQRHRVSHAEAASEQYSMALYVCKTIQLKCLTRRGGLRTARDGPVALLALPHSALPATLPSLAAFPVAVVGTAPARNHHIQ